MNKPNLSRYIISILKILFDSALVTKGFGLKRILYSGLFIVNIVFVTRSTSFLNFVISFPFLIFFYGISKHYIINQIEEKIDFFDRNNINTENIKNVLFLVSWSLLSILFTIFFAKINIIDYIF